MQVTRKEVAQKAGVSTATVSRVLNEPHKVSYELKVKVKDAMRELGHKPNIIARSLNTGKSYQIFVIINDMANPYYYEFCRGIQRIAKNKGYIGTIFDLESFSFQEIADIVLTRKIDGVILFAAGVWEKNINSLIDEHIPIVTPRQDLEECANRIIDVDETVGVKEALKHLLDLGHKDIGFISDHKYHKNKSHTPYRQTTKYIGGVEWKQTVVYENSTVEGGYDGIGDLLEKAPEITAVMCNNDMMAIGAYRHLLDMGIGVPGEMSLVGYDNILISGSIGPGLTTIDMPGAELGSICAKELFYIIEESELSRHHKSYKLSTSLVVRNSTAKPRNSKEVSLS